MKAENGRPYTLKNTAPDKRYFNNDNCYDIYFNENAVEIFQMSRHNKPVQRLVLPKEKFSNFEQMLIDTGFTTNEK